MVKVPGGGGNESHLDISIMNFFNLAGIHSTLKGYHFIICSRAPVSCVSESYVSRDQYNV